VLIYLFLSRSLITALAKASGHKLVRINLSEQTDITDLMGSDLPVQDSESSEASFKWCDGVLLTAIKEGSWVLLDELNLASQSVLEGLNSCLDHRASVYIPELGKTFDCPKTFRVFAAQNPLGQGGGRKGLPKSFLNRFTKVYVNSLTEMDFQSIVASRFPSLDSNNVNRMITFNQRVHMEVEETRSFGHSGSPWEFNLRDVFRWCDLLIASGKYDHSHVRDLYLQRFRSQEDRLKLDAIYREVFGSSALSLAAPIIRVEENFLRVGDTRLQRRVIDNASKSSSMQMEPDILFGYRNPTEAVARCVSLGWPCLLVGPSRSGKSSIIKVLAELCNETVVEQCLSPSSDVTELIGCFEQLDSNANERSIVEDLRMICEEVLFFKSSPDEKLDRVWRLFSKLYSEEKKFIGDEKSSLFLVTKELSDLLLDLVSNDKVLESRCGSLVRTIAARLNCQEKGQEEGKSSHFVWKDGVLVEAMKYGHWLHLENVNLCPASVLDRLNSVMERGGFLLLSECGNQNGEASGYQIIRPHPNFRVFLTMNPMYGEISRAMRNRCVEIAMLPPVQNLDRDAAHSASTSSILDIFNQDAILDSLSVSRRGGLRSFHLVTFLIDSFVNEKRVSEMHGAESPCISTISALATLTTDLLARGIPGTTSILTAVQLSMEVTADQACRYRDNDSYKTLTTNHSSIGLPHDISLRAGWASDGGEADIGWRSRILRPYMNGNTLLLSRVLSKKDGLGISHIDSPPYPELIDSGSGGPFDQSLLDQLLSIFMGNSLMVHCDVVDFFEGMANACSRIISEMVTKLKAMNMIRCSGVIRPQSTGESSASFANDDSNYLQRLITRELIDHIVHRLREEEWIAVVSREEFTDMTTCTMSVLQLSWYIEDGRLDRASITCPVTPTLYPLFKTFDKWVDQTVTNPSSLMTIVDDEMLHSAFHNLLQHRSSMWDTLEACDFSSTNSGFLGFDESEFLVLWRWFNKSLERMITRIDMVAEHLSEGLASLRSMADGINYSVYGGSFQTNAAAVFRKYMNKPLVPQKKEQWIMLNQLKGLSKELSVLDGRFQPLLSQGDALSLPELVDLRHPALFIPPEYRFDLLAALCTAYWSVVDEMGASHRTLEGLALSRNAIKSLQAMFSQQKEAFFASFAAIKVDTRIETVENQLDVAKLEQFRQSIDEFTSESTMYKDISSVLLGTFGRLQLSSIVEFWSLHEEKWLIDNIRQILLFKRNEEDVKQGVLLLVPRLQKFVKIVVSKSLRNVVDMRPYQTLLWAMEQNGNAKEESVITLLRHLLPSMANTYSQGIWTNSFTNLRLVDSKMEMPTLWLDDASVKPSAGFEQLELNVDNCGPIRLEHQVRSELAFRLVGEHFSWYGGLRRTDLCTMENFTSRKAQMADMLDLFSTLDISESHDEPIDVQYFVFEILQSAQECFPDQAFEEILRLVRMPELFAETPIDDMRKFLHLTSNAILKASIDDLMIPLFSSLQSLWNNKSPSNRREQYAMTLIYIGLLRLLVLSPESPQDPGRTPLAKVCLINQRLELVRKKIAAIQLDRWFVHGDLTLECDDAQQVLRHGNHMISKRSSQEKKVIERSDDAPQFYDLFQEVRDFVRGVGRKEQVLGLCRAIRQCHNGGDSFEKVKQREFNWQSTSGAFCTLLDRSYGPYYEEITSNLTESVRSIQNGLRMLLQTKVQPTSVSMVSTAFQQLMRYPVEPSIRQTSQLVSAIVEMTVSRHENSDSALAQTRCQQAAALAALTQLSLQFRLLGMENDLISKVTIILNTMTRSHDGTTPDTDNQENHRTEEEAREKEFHEQFPDHFKEFNSFLQRLGEEEYEDTEEEDALKILASDNTGRLSEEQTTLLCSIHRELFGGQACSVDDALRTRVFATGYSAACSLSKVYDLTKKSTLEEERMATHAMALLTTLSPRNTILGVAPENSGSGDSLVDFHNDPNPSQATHAAKPLESLMTRTAQLLTAFPGHPILLSVGTLCEKVRKFDLLTTPVGRVMAGLEVILKQAQDWEQHASERVKIGQPLQEVSQLVARWRRIQLQSWSRLMKTREGRFVKRARRHFIRLNNILHDDVGKSTGDRSRQGDSSGIIRSSSSLIDLVPSWILKGMNANYDIIPIAKDLFRAEELAELIQILDTFILTSPLGEFHERMAMLRSFALQLRNEVTVTDGTSLWRLQQYRALSAIWFYYMQFSEFLSSHLATLRGPIEKKLNDEVKLAKWDEQSYYSLADSTEKNHRKLMKILAEYDDLLDTNAGQLILQESVKGIRAKVDAHDDFCGSVPDQRAMFPLPMDESDDKQQSTESFEENKSTDESHLWTDTSQIQLPSGRINRLPKLAAKMAAISKSLSVEQTSWVKAGTIVSSELCNAVFERIDALRKGSTRPMKERALVDLFRELKRNGLSSMKWSAPNELRQMKSLLQLPLPLDEVEQSGHALGAAERYLMRCINELNALRSETNILGSKHMSRQQTTAMVHFCEHGLLVLVQQRVILADTLVEKKRLEHLSAAVKTGKHIPSNQEKLKSLVHRFQQSFDCVKEGLGQLSLLLKMSQALLNNPSKMEWVRDTITRFEAQLSALGKFLKLENFGLVSEAHIDSIALMANCLQETENVVISSKVQCGSLGCIPVDAFESVLPAIREATMVSMELSSSVNYSDIAVDTKGGDWSDFLATINQSIDSALITAQGFVPPRVESDAQDYEGGAGDSTSKSILECHRESAKEWGSINLRKLNSTFENTILKLVMFLQKSGMDRETNLKAVGLVADVGILGRKISEMTKVRLRDYISQYKSTSKLVYVLLRVFRTLVSKGFCSDTESDDQDGDADGDISGMNFEDDKDGTGMGEGEGKNDVTDQLENEDQLLGLKGDDKNEQDEQPQSSKELDKEQAEQGMEMEGDFEGEMFDLPEQPPDENNDDEDDGEELDREMNDEANPNEEVVDEKMWDEDNEDEQNGKEEEKFEKDSKTQGDAIEGETRTRDPDEEDNNEKDTSKDQEASVEPKPENGDSGDADEVQDDKDEMDINEDTEDRYEERHGVNVRDDDVDDTAEQEDQMDLDDNLELDDNVAEDDHSDAVQDPDAKNDDIEDEEHDEPNEVDKEAIENDVDEGDEETDPFENAAVPTGAGTINSEDQLPEEEDEPEEEENENPIDIPNAQENHLQETHGVKARDGQDAVLQDEDDEMEDIDGENQGERQNDGGTGSSQMEPSQGMGGTGFGENNNTSEEAENPKNKEERANPPNPFKNPGDASKFWHKKLNMIDNEPDPTSQSDDVEQEDNEINHGGDYEYNPSEQDATQVLGEATEEEAVGLEQDKQEETTEDDHEPEELENDNKGQDEKLKPTRSEKSRARKSDKPSTSMQDQKEEIDDSQTDSSGSEDHVMEDEDQIKEDGTVDSNAPGDETSRENLVVTDTTKLGAREQDFQLSEKNIIEEDIANGVSNMSIVEARTKWLSIQHDTHSLSRRLCEKLRLVMEPLVASKLRGDYRTGKRINMKRVIGYIASGYRKDKIWLRRTKPAKRNYRVLLAVDDSESMAKSGAGEMALRAMATLAVGMNQLEIGEVGVASFGDEMRLVHPFHLPFTSESGVNAVQQFDFDQKRTRTALCVESAMAALDTSGDASSMQLVFMISDGRIERDSRTELKRLIREMFERNILLAMIVVEGKSSSDGSRKDSLVNMKEVTFEKGKPVVKRFIEDYPFPYYIILEDMAALPEVLGDALRQWFEMLAQLQKNS
jgi:midasin